MLVPKHVSCFKIRILEPIVPFHPPATEGNIYALRTFRALPGQVQKWVKMFQDILPVRERYSKNVGAWVADGGNPDETCLMYSYPSIEALTECHRKLLADSAWTVSWKNRQNSFMTATSRYFCRLPIHR